MEKIENFLPKAPAWNDFPDIELYMDQVISVLDRSLSPYFQEEKCITPTMINNYVKQKLLPPPQNKRYGKAQLARLFMIGILKSFMQLSDLSALLDRLGKEESEEVLYTRFVTELDAAVECVFTAKPSPKAPKEANEKALRAALMAVAAIHFARREFRVAAETWKEAEETVTQQAEKDKKEKKEKKKS